MTPWPALFALAATQHGLVERSQAEALGVPARTLDRRALREGWARVQPGVLAVPGSAATPERRIAAAVLACAVPAMATRWSAAYLWGLTDRLRLPVTVVVPHRCRAPRLDGAAVLRSRTLADSDRHERDGIAVAGVARLLADLAAEASLEVLRPVAITARQQGLLDPADLWEMWERMGPARGHDRVRRLLGELCRERTDSILEARVRGLLRRYGLPEPHPEPYPVQAQGRVVARVDIAWPQWRVGVECDGFRYHSRPEDLARDSARQNRLVALGWRIVRVTWEQQDRRPQEVVQVVRALVDPAGARRAT